MQPVLEAHSLRAFTARRFVLTRDSTCRLALHSGRPALCIFIVVMEAIQADVAMEEFFRCWARGQLHRLRVESWKQIGRPRQERA